MYKNKNKESFKRKRPRTPCHSSPLHGMRLAWSCGPRSSALAFLEPSLNNRKMRNRRPESCCVRLVPLRPVCIAPGSLLTLQYSLTECGGLKDIKKTAPCPAFGSRKAKVTSQILGQSLRSWEQAGRALVGKCRAL